jgi:hypothetical protein
MAITTLDGAIAGMQPTWFFFKSVTPTLVAGRPQSLWYLGGVPGAGAAPAASLNGSTLVSSGGLSSNVAGQLPWIDPGSGNSYLARFVADAAVAGKLLLCDRLWHNGGYTITSTSAQTTSSFPTLPSRDINGSANGVGVLLGLEVSATTGAGTPTINVQYTNSGGTASRTGAFVYASVASSAIGSFYPISLQAGDVGVQSLQSITFTSAWASGTVNMVAYRVVASLEIGAAYIPSAIDLVTGGMTQFFNGSVPFLIFIPSTTTVSLISGAYAVTQG